MADEESSTTYKSVAVSNPIRIITAGSFVPAFPLCLAHGIVSNNPVPVVGLVPLAVSAASSILLVRARVGAQGDEEEHEGGVTARGDEEEDGGGFDDFAAEAISIMKNPITVFGLDLVLAAAFMIVLVFTWITHGRSGTLSMLAAYATIPLMACFGVHLYLAVLAFYEGFAIGGLSQWVAWRAVPPDCPNCNTRLRPSLPEFPWLKRLGRRGRRSGYAPVLADDQERYRDDVDGEETQAAAAPEAVEVRRKDRKGKTTPAPVEESASPWNG